MSEIGKQGGKKDAKPETKKRLNYALNPNNQDGYESKWEHSHNATRTNCITCKMVPRSCRSDKCNQCQLAVFAMCSASAPGLTASPHRAIGASCSFCSRRLGLCSG
jgi:hypothetical protein